MLKHKRWVSNIVINVMPIISRFSPFIPLFCVKNNNQRKASGITGYYTLNPPGGHIY